MSAYYKSHSKSFDTDVIEWEPPKVNFEFIQGVCVQRSDDRIQFALAEVVKLMDESEVTQEEAVRLVAKAMDMSAEEATRLGDAYDAM